MQAEEDWEVSADKQEEQITEKLFCFILLVFPTLFHGTHADWKTSTKSRLYLLTLMSVLVWLTKLIVLWTLNTRWSGVERSLL